MNLPNAFYIDIDASAVYGVDAPELQIIVDGQVVGTFVVTSIDSGNPSTQQFLLEFPDGSDFPSSFQLRFSDASGEAGRSIEINDVRVNGQSIRSGSLSETILDQNETAILNAAENASRFGRTNPDISDFGTTTQNGSGGNDDLESTFDDDVVDGGVDAFNFFDFFAKQKEDNDE